jgi:hypothetical protein
MKRLALFIYRAIKFRSISSAMWLDSYDSFTPKHEK